MEKKKKLRGLPLWGAWIGIIGGLFGIVGLGITIYDRFSQPTINEIIGILPVALYSKEKSLGTEDLYDAYGIGAIVHLKNSSRVAMIGGLDLVGKVYMPLDAYMGYLEDPTNIRGRHINEITREMEDKKPFYEISWSGWPEDSRTGVKIEPYEERYISFTFLEPTFLPFAHFGSSFSKIGSLVLRNKELPMVFLSHCGQLPV